MTERTARLRQASIEARPCISEERAVLMTEFYQADEGKLSPPMMRARSFLHLCQHKAIYIGPDEVIVGERGPRPKAVPTFPELTCHSLEDLDILHSRPKTSYAVSEECRRAYEERIIPYWRGRSMRDRIFAAMSAEWLDAYHAGIFTEFMEQRAPGHTVLDDKVYRKGMLDFKGEIAQAIAALDFVGDADAYAKREQLVAMDVACDAVILLAQRHADLARAMADREPDPARKAELERIAAVCSWVPAHAPRDFHEALQMYWWCHLAVITELNGWDSFSPGHLDQHLLPFYRKGLADGTLTAAAARELLEAFLVKFNNHPAPPKVGVTAAESGTYTDFANINLGGLLADGSDGSNELSHMLLEVLDDMHLLQPSNNLQLSAKTPEELLKHALRVIRKGYGFPSVFNTDLVVAEQLRMGKTLEDARAGGCSGCVETGAFGKEAFILTGYFNLPKILELTLHNGLDPRAPGPPRAGERSGDGSGKQLGPTTGAAGGFAAFEDLFAAFAAQFRHFLQVKLAGNAVVEHLYARTMPAPFLSVITDDCIRKGRDYNAGGARYNNSYVQFVGIGSLTDSLAAVRQLVFAEKAVALPDLVAVLDANFEGHEVLHQRLLNRTPKYGNNNDSADDLMVQSFELIFESLDGRPNTKGGHYRVEMLPTTSHIYFGSVTGATPDGRRAGAPLSEGISPVQGADRRGPTAVVRSAAKMDQARTGGALLNMKLTPSILAGEVGIESLARLIRGYFALGGHHIQFNVVTAATLRKAQAHPEAYRDLIVRVAGYSDYFVDLGAELQNEIISRTEQAGF